MDGLFNDTRIFLVAIGTILSALIAKIVKSYDNRFERLEKENEDLRKEIGDTYSIISGHLKYHQGLKNGNH